MSSGPGLPSIDAVLQTLRRGQRHLARNPRGAIQAAVKQLLAGTTAPASGASAPPTYRIDDLARASGVTVRNIRAYQERGLLPPPERVGRTAVFSEAHLARLRIISSMLERGYTAANILEMLHAWESGRDLGQVLGLEGALVPPSGDQPVTVSVGDARRAAGSADDYARFVAEGLIERTGNRARVLRPRLLEAFAEMREQGMSTDALMEVYQGVQPHADEIARILVGAGALSWGHGSSVRTPRRPRTSVSWSSCSAGSVPWPCLRSPRPWPDRSRLPLRTCSPTTWLRACWPGPISTSADARRTPPATGWVWPAACFPLNGRPHGALPSGHSSPEGQLGLRTSRSRRPSRA